MTDFEFTLAIDGPVGDEVVLDRLFEAGCSDALFGEIDGAGYGDFGRDSKSFGVAVSSAIRDVESVRGLRVTRVEPDDLVTQSEIADRLGRSRESVRLLAAGERGPGDFPSPVSHLESRSRLWRWSEVAAWFGQSSETEMERARLVVALNAALELRRLPELRAGDEQVVKKLLAGLTQARRV